MDTQVRGGADVPAALEAAPFVNLRDPAQRLGPDGKPAVSRRAPRWEDVPDEKWNDWRWQLSQPRQRPRGLRGDPRADRRGARGPVRARQVPRGRHAVLRLSLIDPKDPNDPIRRQIIPLGRELHSFTGMMEDSLAEDRHSPVPGLVHRYPDRVLMLITTQCAVVLPVLHAQPDRRRPDPELQPQGARGPARLHPADAADPRRADLGRRRPHAGAEAARERPPGAARDPARRDRAHRVARAGVPAAADRRRALRDAREVPPAVAEHPRQPPQRDHARAVARLRQARQGGRAAGQPVGAPRRRQRLRPHPARAGPAAGREPGPAVLPLPVRPGRGRRPLPDAGRQGPRDHRGPARPHLGLRRAAVHRGRARRRREDPGHAQLRGVVLGPQGDPPQLRGLHHHLRGARRVHPARLQGLPVLPAPAPGAGPGGHHRRCSTASGCGSSRPASSRSTTAAPRAPTGSRTRPSGCRSAWARSRGRSTESARDMPVLEAGAPPTE